MFQRDNRSRQISQAVQRRRIKEGTLIRKNVISPRNFTENYKTLNPISEPELGILFCCPPSLSLFFLLSPLSLPSPSPRPLPLPPRPSILPLLRFAFFYFLFFIFYFLFFIFIYLFLTKNSLA
jgi:hypothetical protein